jgi:hypothetical protein
MLADKIDNKMGSFSIWSAFPCLPFSAHNMSFVGVTDSCADPDIDEQGITYGRGLGLLNKIVGLLLEKETQVDLFGAEISEEEGSALRSLLFDLTSVEKLEDGTFKGKLKLLHPSPSSDSDSDSGMDDFTDDLSVCKPDSNPLQNGLGDIDTPSDITTASLAILENRNGDKDVEQQCTSSVEDRCSQICPGNETIPNDADRMSLSDANGHDAEMNDVLAEEGEGKPRVDSGVDLREGILGEGIKCSQYG